MYTAQQLFDAMRAIVEAPDYPLLKHYQRDFYTYDRQALEDGWAPEAEFLWIVREMGTHLIPLGIHPKASEWGEAALNSEGEVRTYLVSAAEGVTQVDRADAERALANFRYYTSGYQIFHDGTPLVHHNSFTEHARELSLAMTSVDPASPLGLGHLLALEQIASALAVKRNGSLFHGSVQTTLDGAPLSQAIELARARHAQQARIEEVSAQDKQIWRAPQHA